MTTEANTEHIASLTLDEASLGLRRPELEHEREVAINDLTEWNYFSVKEATGPYAVALASAEGRVTFTVSADGMAKPHKLAVSLAPFRSLMRDYALVCESYFEALKGGNLPRIEAIDMSKRGLHNECSHLLADLLSESVSMDSETARRLFTLLFVLQMK